MLYQLSTKHTLPMSDAIYSLLFSRYIKDCTSKHSIHDLIQNKLDIIEGDSPFISISEFCENSKWYICLRIPKGGKQDAEKAFKKLSDFIKTI